MRRRDTKLTQEIILASSVCIMSTPEELQALLFAQLKPRRLSPSAGNMPSPHTPQTSNPSQPFFDPGALPASQFSAPPADSPLLDVAAALPVSSTASPSQGAAAGSIDRAQSLLSLLKFGQPTAQNPIQQPEHPALSMSHENKSQEATKEPSISTPNLLARLMTSSPISKENANGQPIPGLRAPEPSEGRTASNSQELPQDALLRLLNRPKSSNSETRSTQILKSASPHQAPSSDSPKDPISTPSEHKSPVISQKQREESPLRMFGSAESREMTPFEAPKIESTQPRKENKPIFTYTNPFEALNASRPQLLRPHAPLPETISPAFGISSAPGSDVEVTIEDKRKSSEKFPEPTSTRRKLKPLPTRPSLSTQQGIKKEPITDDTLNEASEFQEERGEISLRKKIKMESPEPQDAVDTSATYYHERLVDTSVQVQEAEEEIEDAQETNPSQPLSQVFNDITNDTPDLWESADDSAAKEDHERVVPVYNFPIKPFVSITLKAGPNSDVGLRDDGVMEISRLKKEFDQLDRSLAAATSKYITYALVKNGGMRIIRQDDGSDRQVFKYSHDRIFNVAICTTAMNTVSSEEQAVLGVGVSGSVYYATVSKKGSDLFEDDALDSESLIFPPYPLGDENTSGGVLKTRAKKSSRHPEFFAIGRGKSIHIIWPATALSSKYGVSGAARKVDIEKLYKDRSLKITTGKAGKDFAFSEDDTLIVSLDKIGRLRFWDIRQLVDEANATASRVAPIEVRTPLLTLATASPSEKSWPTSVLFIDKLRPYSKNAALRYILVGLKQNHTLQLWDIGLGKAVQELNFPHETETDGICSVSYHPNSGVIVVGHPTRNSIYFIHLSAPRYTLTPMSQASYIEGTTIKDPDLPKPDSTAYMSDIREISFAAKGQLRSIELLPIYKGTDGMKDSADAPPLFELYVVHSKGVTCLNIRKEDLGWSSESKVLHPINAAEEGLITMKDLRLGTVVDESAEPNGQPDEVQQMAKSSKRKSLKKTTEASDAAAAPTRTPEQLRSDSPGLIDGAKSGETPKFETPADKEIKKNKKRSGTLAASSATKASSTSENLSRTISPSKEPISEKNQRTYDTTTLGDMGTIGSAPRSLPTPSGLSAQVDPDTVTVGISGDWLDKELKKFENFVSGEFRKELDSLYRHIQNDRNVQDSASVARQEAVLRLVSTTLSTNIENSLGRIIVTQMQQILVPSITGVAVQAVSAQVGEAIARVLHQLVPHELGTQLPVAISTALQNPQMLRVLSETISQKVATQTETHLTDLLHKKIAPSFKNLAISVAEKAAAEVENRVSMQLQQFKIDRHNENAKIDKLHDILNGIAETLQAMSGTQVDFQEQILKDRRQLAQLSGLGSSGGSRQASVAREMPALVAPTTPAKAKTREEIELDEISTLMNGGQYEEGSIRWLQSSQPVELFDKLFVRFTPEYLATDVSPLVAFSVGVTVGNSLSTNTARRLDWINAAFGAVDLRVSLQIIIQYPPRLITNISGIYHRTPR